MPTTRTCFVIMPYGKKPVPATNKKIDFDEVYSAFIKPAVESLDIDCYRSDEVDEAGAIHPKMYRQIYESDLAVADITLLNPNVFYELGVRHALAKSITILIRRSGTTLPFDIQSEYVCEYDPKDWPAAIEKLGKFIGNVLKNEKVDSPVLQSLRLKIASDPKHVHRTDKYIYKLRNSRDKQICLITGELLNVHGVDVWVNSENVNMEMARHFERSISSVIRFNGARREDGEVVHDTIALELANKMRNRTHVAPGQVVVTGSGELEASNEVKKIFHAAAVFGQPGVGYAPIHDIGRCVTNALSRADELRRKGTVLESILFPLMGTGQARGDRDEKASQLIGAAISHLDANPNCAINRVFFLTWTEEDLDTCRRLLGQASEVDFVRIDGARPNKPNGGTKSAVRKPKRKTQGSARRSSPKSKSRAKSQKRKTPKAAVLNSATAARRRKRR
jgi:O-acetyl-ADP-ribose deacetylase (regulator of RNase III)